MNRLFPRLMLAMLLVSLLSLIAVPLAQALHTEWLLERQTREFREFIEARTAPPGPLRRPMMLPGGEAPEPAARYLSFLSDYRRAQRQGVVSGLAAAVLVSLLLSWWLARGVAQPIEKVSAAATRLAGGDLKTRVALAGSSLAPDEARLLAGEFNRMAEALERTEAERKAMIADIAHELRAPLASLQFRLEALRDGLVSFGEAEAELLQRQVGLLTRLVGDLRTLSLADAGRLSLERRDTDLLELLREAATAHQNKAEAEGVQLAVADGLEDVVLAVDPDRLRQVLHNLLENALSATPAGGFVRLGLERLEREVRLTLTNSGPAIPEAKLETIFERFVKGERRDTRAREGSGLGLAIAKALVTLHGGRIWASNTAAGVRFSVALPRETEPKQNPQAP